MERHQGRRALVTGAASGIGRASSLRLAQEGATVYCADLNTEGLAETVSLIEGTGARAYSGSLDVADPASCKATVEAAVAALGGLDVLANIAGILKPAHTISLAISDWDRIIAINLSGVFYMSQAALPHLLDGGGAIVNMASVAGLQGVPYGAPYSASKAGVIGLTRSLAAEYARKGLRANAVCPGGVETPMTSGGFRIEGDEPIDPKVFQKMAPIMDRVGTPDEIAALVSYLASDEAGYITGTAITIDGGQIA